MSVTHGCLNCGYSAKGPRPDDFSATHVCKTKISTSWSNWSTPEIRAEKTMEIHGLKIGSRAVNFEQLKELTK
jgi:hypothetical protein